MIDYKFCFVTEKAPEYNEYSPYTLCEICENACGFCSWSKKNVQKPVEGWEAIRNDLICHDGDPKSEKVESYVVLSCPEYVPDKYAEKYPFNREHAIKSLEYRKQYSDKMQKLKKKRV